MFQLRKKILHLVAISSAISLCTLSPSNLVASNVVYTQSESTFNGQPFMMRGIFGVNIPDVERTAGYGFKIIQTYQFGSMTEDVIAEYMDAARKNGLKVLFHLNYTAPKTADLERESRLVQKFKNHDALYVWYLADEPSIQR